MTFLCTYLQIRSPLCLRCHHKTLLRQFHSTRSLRAEVSTFPNHYSTLNLPATATPAEIKASFYALSKKHHPDLNPSTSSSQKFVQISEAYHILGSPTKRSSYDRDYARIHQPPVGKSGSHSSYSSRGQESSPVGGRPASGLSRRRTQFRGPPPSFYRAGGYGDMGGKRQQPSSSSPHASSANQQSQAPPGGLGSQPFSDSESAYPEPDPAIPHWDRAGHRRTHETLEQRRARQGKKGRTAHHQDLRPNTSFFLQFLAVTGVVALAAGVPAFFSAKSEVARRRKAGEG